MMKKIAGVNNQELPVDLLFEVLAKLPAKSLCRFRCVSKLWRSLIADPCFVEAHRACSAARPESLILISGLGIVDGTEEHIRHAYTCNLDAVGTELHSPDNRDRSQTYRILVSVQHSGYNSRQAGGLYCLDFLNFVRVWNPTTRESLDIKTVEAGTYHHGFNSISHFGFDPVEKKHKVLDILAENYTSKAVRSRVFILEDNCWRTTANAYPPHLRAYDPVDVICTDGIIFFVTYTSHFSERKLIAFHVRSETFEVISFPKGAENSLRLIEFAGHATLASFNFSDPGEGITLWMLEDFRKQAWRRKTCIIPNYDLRSLTLRSGTPTGELLFTGKRHFPESFFLLLYNVEGNSARRVQVQGLPGHTREHIRFETSAEVYVHVESLKSPKGPSSLISGTNIQTLNRSESRICSA